jgi:hypothetical protein
VLLCAAVWVVGCGGNDREDAERTVRDFIAATNERDADKFCDDLVTRRFLEDTTGANGDEAHSVCKKQFTALRGRPIRLVGVRRTRVHGDKADVTAAIAVGGQERPQLFRLRKEGGDWRVATGTGE